MKHFRNNNHYTTYGWMLDKLGLRDARLTIYAIVYSFSQDGETEYYGGRKYMAEASGRSLPTVDRVLNELEKDGLIKKCDRVNDGVSHCRYSVYLDENGEGIINPPKEENDDNTPYHDDNTPYHDDNTPYHDDNTHINNKYNNKYNKEKNKDKSLSKNPREGFIFENEMEANFFKWCYENVPNLMENKRPLTYKQFISLQGDGFPKQTILNKMLYMDAKARFNKDYKNVYAVLKNWLLSDRDPNYRERFKNKKGQSDDSTSK